MVAQLEKNEKMAQAALANTMSLGWQTGIRPADEEIPFERHPGSLEELAGDSYRFNPDWGKLEAAMQAVQVAVRTGRSGYYPKVAVTGEFAPLVERRLQRRHRHRPKPHRLVGRRRTRDSSLQRLPDASESG